MKEKTKNSLEVFESAPVGQAVMKNTVPAMVAMLMVLVYNLADTFFIGQTKDALMVASVSLVTPAFLLFMAVGTVFGFGLSTVMTVICYLFDRQIVSAFLSEAEALSYGIKFSRILLTTSFLFGMFYVLSNALQAMGAATAALIINMSRQGLIYIPAIFILQAVIGMEGLLWAQPVADILLVILVIVLYRITLKNKMRD